MIPGAFKYKNRHSTEFNIISRSVNRSLLPPLRPKTLEITDRHGLYDFTGNTYGNRTITMEIAYIGRNYNELRNRAREIAAWLTSKQAEKLVFDDEPEKFYLARIYTATPLENLWRLGWATITFDCQPFAYSLKMHSLIDGITTQPFKIEAKNQGTQETPVVITLKNQGSNINAFDIRIEYEID